VAVVAEAYVNGVSTRKVERLVAQLGIESMSRSTVSRLCKTLDEQVRIFRERPLEGRYPYLCNECADRRPTQYAPRFASTAGTVCISSLTSQLRLQLLTYM